MRSVLIILFLIFLRYAPQACQFPVYPVDVTLTLTDKNIIAHISNNVVFWQHKVLHTELDTPGAFTDELRSSIEEYINEHLLLRTTSGILPGRLVRSAYRANPWVSADKATVYFEMVYDINRGLTDLEITSTFFHEHHDEAAGTHSHGHGGFLVSHVFETRLRVASGRKHTAVLAIEQPSITIAASQYMQTAFQRWAAAFFNGLRFSLFSVASVLFLIIAALVVRGPLFRHCAWLSAAIAVGMAAGYLVRVPSHLLAVGSWLCVLYASLQGYHQLGLVRAFMPPAAAGVVLGMIWHNALEFQTFQAVSVLGSVGMVCGGVVSVVGVSYAVSGLLVLYKKVLTLRAEAVATLRFEQHRHFAAVLLSIVAVLAIAQILRAR